MDENNRKQSYEGLYSELYDRAQTLHENNKSRIRRGLIGLIVLPAVLIFIRRLTDSDKVVFLIIWIIGMFLLCAYLIMIEYLDSSVQRTIEDVTNQEAEFDDLLLSKEAIQGRLRGRMSEIRAAREARLQRLEHDDSKDKTPSADGSAPENQNKGGAE